MSRYSSKISDLLDSIKLTYTELQTLNYPPCLFADALSKILRNRSAEPGAWNFLHDYIDSLLRGSPTGKNCVFASVFGPLRVPGSRPTYM